MPRGARDTSQEGRILAVAERDPVEGTGAYKQQLARHIGLWSAVIITVAGISPIASVYIIAPVVFSQQGSGVFLAMIGGAVICFGMAMCYAELGSIFPVAGGQYSIVARVLGKPIGFLAFLDYMVLALIGPSTIGLGTAQYFGVVWPDVNPHLVGVVTILVATGIAILPIKDNALVNSIFFAVQVAAIGIVTVLAALHIHQPLSVLFHPQTYGSGTFSYLSFSALMAGVALAITVYNGYDGPLVFSEEMRNPTRNVPQAVYWALSISALFAFVPLTIALLSAPSLKALTTSSNPMSYITYQLGGYTFLGGARLDDLVSLAVVIAMFNASLAGMLSLGRIFYSSGRDRAWPGPTSGWMAYVHPGWKTPIVATLFIGLVGAAVTATTNLATVVTFAALLLVVLYAFSATAGLVSRLTQKTIDRPYRMPLWPVPPLVALVGAVIITSQSSLNDVAIVAGILAVGVLYYVFYLRPRPDRWVMRAPVGEETGESKPREVSPTHVPAGR